MQQVPIYQGTQHAVANTTTATPNVPRRLLFADEWEKNRHEATRALQGIEEALIERNDNTVLLNQQAEAKRRNLEMTMEMGEILSLANGAEGGWYDMNGKLNKQAVRDFVNKYSSQPIQWGKALISSEAAQKSASATLMYQDGVAQAVGSAILANTKKREEQALKENIRLSAEMGAYEDVDQQISDGQARGLFSPQQAEMAKRENRKSELEAELAQLQDVNSALDKWEDPNFRGRLAEFPEMEEKFERFINQSNKTQGFSMPGTYKVDPKTGKTTETKEEYWPPAGAPVYLQDLLYRYKGKPPVDEAVPAMQQYLSQEIDSLKGSKKGDLQWSVAKDMATETLGLTVTDFNQLYETRAKQLSYGGFDAPSVLKSIPIQTWLDTTTLDEALPADLSNEARDKEHKKIADNIRTSIQAEYDAWWAQNQSRDISPKDQCVKLLDIARSKTADVNSRKTIDAAIRRRTAGITERGLEIAREIIATEDRKRASQKADSYSRFNRQPAKPDFQRGKISSTVAFDYELAPVDSNLEGSRTQNIIYLPKSSELPAKGGKVNVSIKNGYVVEIEFKHADVQQATPSRRLLCSLGIPTKSPARLTWDGNTLNMEEWEAAVPYVYGEPSLFPDDGLVPYDGSDPTEDPNDVPEQNEDWKPLPI